MHIAIRSLATVAGLAALSGCMAQDPITADQPDPTHRWVTQMEVSRAKYNFDNKTCTDEAMLDVETVRESDPEFADYERCMAERGYNLATY